MTVCAKTRCFGTGFLLRLRAGEEGGLQRRELFGRHGRQREAELITAKPLGSQRGLNRNRIDLGKQCVDERQRSKLQARRLRKIPRQRMVAQSLDQPWPKVGKHADHAGGAKRHRCDGLVVAAVPDWQPISAQLPIFCKRADIASGLLEAGNFRME